MAIQPHSRIESQLTDPTYNGPYLSRIELILKDMLENYGRIAFVGPYDSLEDLPETGQAGYVYLVRVEDSNLCDEYIWDEQEEEYNYVGRFEIDLDDYQTKDLSNPITIDSVVYTTVETALAAMNTSLSGKANSSDLGTAASKNSTNQLSDGSVDLIEAGAVKTALDGKEESGVAETLVKDTVGWSGKNQAYDVTYTSTKNQYASVIRTSYKLKQGKRYVISFYTVNTDIAIYRDSPSTLGFDSLSEYAFVCDGTRKSMYGTATADAIISNIDIFKRASGTSDVESGLCYDLQIEEVADNVTTPTSYEPYHATVDTVKADKVTNATSGHLAGLDSNGNLTDSGVSPTEDVTVEGNPVTFDSPFEQDAKSVVVSVKPIQDLHGYDHPWVGGAGKNKVNPTANPFGISAGTGVTNYEPTSHAYIAKGLAGETVTVSRSNHTSSGYFWYGAYAETALATGLTPLDYGDIGDNLSATISVPVGTVILVIFTGADEPIDLQVEIGSSATSYAPYSNECPISGIDELEIGVSGKNQLNYADFHRIDPDTQIQNNQWAVWDNYIACKENETVTVNCGIGNVTIYRFFARCYDVQKNFIGQVTATYIPSNNYTFTINVPGAKYFRFQLYHSSSLADYDFSHAQLEHGSTPTAFEPYNHNSHTTTIPLPSTLYDADVDVTEGSGTDNGGLIDLVNGVETTWSTLTSGGKRYFYNSIVNGKKTGTSGGLSGVKCSCFKPTTADWQNMNDGEISIGSTFTDANKCSVAVRFEQNITAPEFAALIAGQTASYPLATPTTISLTPTDVELLEGTNVVTTNGEKVAVTYGRSLWQDIDKLKTDTEGKLNKSDVADVEGDTASRPYAVNEFMLRADGFYMVTQPIASGASITASNTTKTTIGAVLTALLNA